ncbi:methyltransferase domain-containing protein [Georgenia phoenicis]|uniref:class I SAM-dependent methyltransferase n=1 Tax=unclassified Georgenia TaxID=2626815 RepID=UPI0039B06B2E
MRPFGELVHEAAHADVGGWDFAWLTGRATEERPPWRYSRVLAERLAQASSALDVDTGGGEVLAEAPVLPPTMVATESWPPNFERARRLLGPRGVRVVRTDDGAPPPFADATFDLVTCRHPVRPDWSQIARVLAPGGHYVAQHVGPDSAVELIEHFTGPLPRGEDGRDPHREAAAAVAAGLDVVSLESARCRMVFHDVGAVVWILRRCVWWVPDFSVTRYERALRELDAQLRGGRALVTHSTRHLVVARRPA